MNVVEEFHKLWYDSNLWMKINYLGVGIQKNPFDLWIYHFALVVG